MIKSKLLQLFKRARGDYSIWKHLSEDLDNRTKKVNSTLTDIYGELSDLQKELFTVERHLHNLEIKQNTINHFVGAPEQSRLHTSEKQTIIANSSGELFNSNITPPMDNDTFLLFHYFFHLPTFHGFVNLGDYIQTLATRNVLSDLNSNCKFSYWDRDCLSFFKPPEKKQLLVCIMQGWFSHSLNFLPNQHIKPVWVGTHFDKYTQNFLKELVCVKRVNPELEIGCRDLYTQKFCQTIGVKSYFSRCLTLTFPQRQNINAADKVYLVDIPERYKQYLPKKILDEGIQIEQKWVNRSNQFWKDSLNEAELLLNKYKTDAKLVITTALHCAAPCVAMGIPTILISDNEQENERRFSALRGILPFNTIKDLADGSVNFEPEPVEIEPLKMAIKENLKLSIRKELGNYISEQELKDIRSYIAEYNSTNLNENR